MSSPEARGALPPKDPTEARRSKSRAFRLIIGYVAAALCLAWVFHDVDWKRFVQGLAAVNWTWIPLAVLGDTLSYVCQGVRWHWLLKPQGRLSVLRTTEAIYFGMFLNETLPLRVGEVARGYLVSRWMAKPLVAIIPSMALERLIEGLWVTIAIGVTAIFVPLPKDLMKAGDILGVAVLAATALILFLALRKKKPALLSPASPPSRGKIRHALRVFFNRLDIELRAIGLSWELGGAFLATFVMYACQVLAFWLVMEAYGIHRSLLAGAVVFLVVHLGTALPNAPANVGTYQLFCVLGLAFFGVDKTAATAFSVIVFILLSVPLWALGAVAFGRSGMTLASFRQKIPKLEAQGKDPEAKPGPTQRQP